MFCRIACLKSSYLAPPHKKQKMRKLNERKLIVASNYVTPNISNNTTFEKAKYKSAIPKFVRANIILPALMKRLAENKSQKRWDYKNSYVNTASSDVN